MSISRLGRAARLAPLFVIASALGCSGDDTNPAAPDSGAADTGAADGGARDATLDGQAPSEGGTAPEAGPPDAKSDASPADAGPLGKINHVVVIYMENHSFDNLYGDFPGADGLLDASAYVPQTDPEAGAPYAILPMPKLVDGGPVDPRLPTNLPNAPWYIEDAIPADAATPDLLHIFYLEQAEANDGGMNLFAGYSNSRGLAVGRYRTANLPVATEAQSWTVCDRFFHAAWGGSFLNHQWLIAAQSPPFPGAPAAIVNTDPPTVLPAGSEKAVTADGFAVNTLFSSFPPHPYFGDSAAKRVPPLTYPNIGDELTGAGVDWAWYAGGWNDAVAWDATDGGATADGGVPPSVEQFQYHHQPFNYFASYAPGQPGRAHLKDEIDFDAALAANALPAVAFVKPVGIDNEHPGYADVLTGEQHLLGLIKAIEASSYFTTSKDVAIVVTYDEHGGFADHVPPPRADRWGPGERVPTIVISPYAKKHFVDHTTYDTTSILAFIEKRWGLAALSTRDGHADPLSGAFDFTQTP